MPQFLICMIVFYWTLGKDNRKQASKFCQFENRIQWRFYNRILKAIKVDRACQYNLPPRKILNLYCILYQCIWQCNCNLEMSPEILLSYPSYSWLLRHITKTLLWFVTVTVVYNLRLNVSPRNLTFITHTAFKIYHYNHTVRCCLWCRTVKSSSTQHADFATLLPKHDGLD